MLHNTCRASSRVALILQPIGDDIPHISALHSHSSQLLRLSLTMHVTNLRKSLQGSIYARSPSCRPLQDGGLALDILPYFLELVSSM